MRKVWPSAVVAPMPEMMRVAVFSATSKPSAPDPS